MKRSTMILLVVIFIIGILLIALIIYFLPPIKDYRELSRVLNSHNKYSASGDCEESDYQMLDDGFEYNPSKTCSFVSSKEIIKAIDIYDSELTASGWNCLLDSLGNGVYYRHYYKGEFKTRVDFYVSNRISLTVQKETPDLSFSGCKKVKIVGIEPIRDKGGMIINPGLTFNYENQE